MAHHPFVDTLKPLRSEHAIRLAVLIVWAAVCLEVLSPLVFGGSTFGIAMFAVVVMVGFLITTLWVIGPGLATNHRRVLAGLLVCQTIIGTLFDTDLFYIVSIMLPFLYRVRTATIWMVVRNVVGLPYFCYLVAQRSSDHSVWPIAIGIIPHFAWQVLAFTIGRVAATERQRRQDLMRVNTQLLAAQDLLTDRARLEERLEISRELHDTLGHHLVGLNVQLELARHQARGPAIETIARAQAAGRRMLGEVRGIVSAWRADAIVDLPVALEALTNDIATPRIVIDVRNEVPVTDPAVSRALFRCAQELVTNAVRHAHASHVWLELAATESGVRLVGRDDGEGCEPIELGNGLRGIHERIEALRGRVTLSSTVAGFVVELWVPAGVAS